MQRFSVIYIIGFSTAICVVCSLLVSTSAVGLRDRQQDNIALDRQKNVILAAGLDGEGESLTPARVAELFKQVKSVVVELKTGQETEIDPMTFDQAQATKDPATSSAAQRNAAGVLRVPHHATVYQVFKDGRLDEIILPIEGKGLWSTLYGFLALDADCTTIRGITFYQHGETPGLGGEVDNPRWKALWKGRKAFDETWTPRIEVIKGHAGPPSEAPHKVDGLSGATITGRGVSHLVQFWLGERGFGPYLQRLREGGGPANG